MRIYHALPIFLFATACNDHLPTSASPNFVKLTPAQIEQLAVTTTMPTNGTATYSGNFSVNPESAPNSVATGNMLMTADFSKQQIGVTLSHFQQAGSANSAAGVLQGLGQINGTNLSTSFAGTLTARDAAGNLAATSEQFTGNLSGGFRGDDAKAANGTITMQATTSNGIPTTAQVPLNGTFSVNK